MSHNKARFNGRITGSLVYIIDNPIAGEPISYCGFLFRTFKIHPLVMMKILLLVVLIATVARAVAQAPQALHHLLTEYEQCGTDSGRAYLLLRIDSLYVYKLPKVAATLDSEIILAAQARELAQTSKAMKTWEDATYLLARTWYQKKQIAKALPLLAEATRGLKVHLLILMGEYYSFKPEFKKTDLDSAYPYILRAKALSDSLHSDYWRFESLCLQGKYYFLSQQYTKGVNCFMEVIRAYQRSGDLEKEAFWWHELGLYIPDNDSTYPIEMSAQQHAKALYYTIKPLNQDLLGVLADIATIYSMHHKDDSALDIYLETIATSLGMGLHHLCNRYSDVSELYLLSGNYPRALSYAIAAVRNMDTCDDYRSSGPTYFQLAECYRMMDQPVESLQWYRKSMDNFAAKREDYLFMICLRIVNILLHQSKNQEALAFFRDFTEHHRPLRFIDRECLAEAMGNYYNTIGKYEQAEQNYLQMISMDSLRVVQEGQDISAYQNFANTTEVNYLAGRFYVEQGRWEKARSYLNNTFVNARYSPALAQLMDTHLLLYKIDSAEGQYLPAIRELATSKRLNDSIFTIAKSRQIEEMQVKYETERKDEALQVLRTSQQLQQKEIQRADQTRWFTYALIGLLLVALGIGFSRYRLKQRSNLRLQAQQDEINRQYKELATLLDEKEWLVTEIHHRVKNNLQMVISLLNVQSEYLQDSPALAAIRESRERMQVIALIHQRLYQSEQHALINMDAYIGELIDLMEQGITGGQRIRCERDVDAIDLDVSQAVPVALILNEAITNAIKYAFPERRRGVIIIRLKKSGDENILLSIDDNGAGYSAHFNPETSNSFGLRLITLFAKQLGSGVTFSGKEGAHISIEFRQFKIVGKQLALPV